jgi:5-methylcytosine-specific restriction endonuclease McrA
LNEFVDFYLQQKAPKMRKLARPTNARTRHIPVATRDAVMIRDKQRCTFRSRSGKQCNSRHDLQIDHIKPYALGGTHEPENLRVLCAAHNRHEARKTFGERSVPMRN